MSKLILIDGNAILHRAFHALPHLTSKRGEPINAVYGLVSMLLRIIQDLKPTHIAVCFDEKAPTFRHKEFVQYQSQRPPMPQGLSSQFEKAKQFLAAARIPVYSKPGFEADDVIGTLAAQAIKDTEVLAYKDTGRKEKETQSIPLPYYPSISEVVIVSGDRDILQLVNERVKVYMPIVGLTNARLMGAQDVAEKMGVKPWQIPDYKALVGDPSDNYPGVSGIGPKTAISLLTKYKSLKKIYSSTNEIPESTRKKLIEGKDSAELSLRLATIVRDTPVVLNIEKTSKWDIDGAKVLQLFSDFGFKTLRERVKKVGQDLDKERQLPLI